MKKRTALLFLAILFTLTESHAQRRSLSSLRILPDLLSCEQGEELKGQVRSVVEKRSPSGKEKDLQMVSFTRYDEENRRVMRKDESTDIHSYYHYGPAGRLQSITRYFKGEPGDSAVYVYHDDGRARAVMTYLLVESQNLVAVKDIRYDSTGMPIMVADRKVFGTAIEKVIRIGDDYIDLLWGVNAKFKKTLRYPFDPERKCIFDDGRYIENIEGETTLKIFENRNRKNRLIVFEYEYDEVGNWVVLRVYDIKTGQKLLPRYRYSMRVREIEYR